MTIIVQGYKTHNHPLYMTWLGMKKRCYEVNHSSYKYYGARGIRVSDEWLIFANFCRDMAPKPSEDVTLDRVDNEGGYEFSNCRWATKSEQQRNKGLSKNNTSGDKGVSLNGNGRYSAEYVGHFLGSHATVAEAVEARAVFIREYEIAPAAAVERQNTRKEARRDISGKATGVRGVSAAYQCFKAKYKGHTLGQHYKSVPEAEAALDAFKSAYKNDSSGAVSAMEAEKRSRRRPPTVRAKLC